MDRLEPAPRFCDSADAEEERVSRKRVLLFTNSVFMGGMERHVEMLARDLDRASFEVLSITPDWPRTAAFEATMRRVSDHHATITPDRRRGIVRQGRELIRLYRYLRCWRPDVMHMHLTAYRGGLLTLLTARLARVQTTVCTEHLAPEEKRSLPRWLLRYLFVGLLDQLICVSDKNREERARYLYTPPERTTVIVNGIDTDDFSPIDPTTLSDLRRSLGLPWEARVVGSVVRLEPEKGLGYLLDAMPAVLKACPDAYLLLVGEGTLRDELEAHAIERDIRDRVIFAGFQADPRRYLALIDAFVLPVPVGSMSIGLLEAMAMSRPVVITFGSPGEAVVHEESGLWSPPRDANALADSILRLLNYPDLARSYGVAARRRVEQHFSSESVALTLAVLYSELTARTSAR